MPKDKKRNRGEAAKVIFLDIDGVLNSRKTKNPRKFPYIVEPKLLRRLKRLVGRTGAKVILCSTWRYDPAGLYSARYWGIPFVDTTPDMPSRPRRDEILAWLKKHPKITRFVVIDDDDDELDQLPLFQPSSKEGLSDKIVGGAARYLNGKANKTMRLNRIERFLENVHSTLKGHPG